ncbi:PilZ domain-containing protein [Amphritea atlantica]|uniref:PilZ domain-containing protein n=1 Tax=Amphritea atlantica TaxID=355243 RepID=A0A1H9KXH8_9GAMM|nr:PilZ domain-containing protein [Amphritea atlantica]SER03914.1 PilZ domain-containing protein [Amphritea atlantica]
MLTDSRLHPRVDADFEVRVGIPGDNTGARIINISLGGVAIQGSQALVQVLKNDNANPKGVSEHVVSFSMPDGELSEVCRLIHIRRLSQSRFEFGMKFVDLNPQDEQIIASYVDRHVV